MPPEGKRQRIYLSPSPKMRDYLEYWAEKEKRPIANLCTYLVETAVEAAVADGTIPSPPPEPPEQSQGDRFRQSAGLLAKLVDGKTLEPEEEETLAGLCNRSPLAIHKASKKIKEGNGSGRAKAKR